MKKINNKKRKLEYIREKNHYRLGGFGCDYLKVSKEIRDYKEYFENFLIKEYFENFLIKEIYLNIKKVESIFKIPLKIFKIETGFEGNDLSNEVITVKYYYRNENN